jgi:hypothetical protein
MKRIIITVMALLAMVSIYEPAGAAKVSVGTTVKSFSGKNFHIEGYCVLVKRGDGSGVGLEAHEAELRYSRYNGRYYEVVDEEPLWFVELVAIKNITKIIYLKAGSGIESVGSNFIYSANVGAIVPVIARFSVLGEAGYSDYRYIHGRTVSIGVSRSF